VRDHLIHLVNTDSSPAGRTTLKPDFRLLVRRVLPSTFTIVFTVNHPKRRHSFYHPIKSARLSRPRQCSKGVQPVPKAVCYNGPQLPRCDSILRSQTLQSAMLPLEMYKHCLFLSLPGEMLQNGDRREVEIRGCTIWAVEASYAYFHFRFHKSLLQQTGIVFVTDSLWRF